MVLMVWEVINNMYYKDLFKSADISTEQIEMIDIIREKFTELAGLVDRFSNDGRYKSLTMTTLEEASHWAVSAISKDFKETI